MDKYWITKVNYSSNHLNIFKKHIIKKYLYKNIEDKLDNIKLNEKKLMNFKLEYVDKNDKDIEKSKRIYGQKILCIF